MKVELQCGDKITIPEGCKAIIKDGCVEIEKVEVPVPEFKDGDIVILCGRTKKDRHPFIFKREDDGGKQKFYIGIDFANVLHTFCDDEYYDARQLHHATEEEKQLLFDKMKEQRLRWNAEEKKVEKTRWRAEKGYIYHRLTCYLRSTHERDDYQTWNKKCHDSYNYFHTEEQTKEAAKRVRETLRKYHEEIGE
ncbi:MAG: hypothetical protein HXN33_07760 [Prevotella histicola]|uniref:Uncharacterized protein n=1 Tax=Prevotella histicola TaxID=470565 RepID=A0A930N7A4_9BACT|nr:hypothetical protein [Prevotella histicola]